LTVESDVVCLMSMKSVLVDPTAALGHRRSGAISQSYSFIHP